MTMSPDQIDELLRRNVIVERLGEAESKAIWERIEMDLSRSDQTVESSVPNRRSARGSRRLGLAAGALALALVVITAVSLAPWSDSGQDNGALSLARLDSASAAQVLGLTAESAGEQPSLVPGPGQVLYFRLLHTTDPGALGDSSSQTPEQVAIEEWIAADGRGVRLDGTSGSSSMSNGKLETSPDYSVFDASRSVDSRLTVDSSWRSIFTLDELESIPADSDAALDYVREGIEKSTLGSDRQSVHEAGIVGVDFLVLSNISRMLMEAPLSAGQRSVLFDVLAETPEWYRNNGSAKAQVTNQGTTRTADGNEGILIEDRIRLNPVEAAIIGSGRREISYGVVLDPEAGTVLETQVSLGADRPPVIRTTSEALEIQDRDRMPSPAGGSGPTAG